MDHPNEARDKQNRSVAETKIANSEETFKLLVDAVEDYAIFALDVNGFIQTWNSGGERLKGYTASEVIGQHFSKFYTEPDIKKNHPAYELERARNEGKYEEEGWRVRKDGTTFWANIIITALRDKEGNLRGFGKVTRDLTNRRNAELALKESEERFRLLVSSVTDYAIITLDPEGYVTSWNAGAERIKGYRPKEIIGKHFSNFYPQSEIDNGKPEMELRIASDEGRYEEEGWRVRKDGTMFWANVTITAMRDEHDPERRLRGFAKVTRDLTERKKAEDQLRAAYEQLEERVMQRTKELSDAKVRAEQAVLARDQFFSIASHELKTPLSSLKLQTQLRQRNIAKGRLAEFAPERLAELYNDDARQIARLVFLVDNMLDVSKLRSGNFELVSEEIDLEELVQDVLRRMQPIFNESGNTIKVSAGGKIIGTWDRHRIEQVFMNLLSNIAKYAAGKPAEVEITAQNGWAKAVVRDQGKGIPAEHLERIFQPYERIKDITNVSGLGLGLYIIKQIVEAHSGRISVRSQVGQGSEFTLELPLEFKTQRGETNA